MSDYYVILAEVDGHSDQTDELVSLEKNCNEIENYITMPQAFLRHKVLFLEMRIELAASVEREKYHTQILHDILEV